MSARSHAEFGWGASPFAEQFPGLEPKDANAFDEDNCAIVRLHVRGVITDSQRDHAIRKVTKALEAKLLRPAPPEPTPRHGDDKPEGRS